MFQKETKKQIESQSNRLASSSDKEITKTWLTGQKSCTLIIPREIARRQGLEEPSHVVVQETSEGILIRKLDLQREEN
jgi:glutamate synthase domain-containing protein 3